jgi:antitoxin YefM
MLSKETAYSQARMNLASILDRVCDESQIIVIKRRNQKNVALIAEDGLSSLLECVYSLHAHSVCYFANRKYGLYRRDVPRQR